MKFPFYYQLEAKDCGPTCLRIIAAYYGKYYSLSELKSYCSINKFGINLKDIMIGSERIGLNVLPIMSSFEKIEQIPLPAILHWEQNHFIVLYKIVTNKEKRRFFFISDPAYGKIKIEEKEFKEKWLGSSKDGIALLLEPTDKFYLISPKAVESSKKSFAFLFINSFSSNRFKFSISGVLLFISLLCSWLFPFVFEKMIDKGVLLKNISVITLMLLFQFGLFISQSISSWISNTILLNLNYQISIQFLENLLKKLARLPMHFFDTRLQTDILNRMDDSNRVQSFLTQHSIEFLLYATNIILFSVILVYFNYTSFIINFFGAIIAVLWTLLFIKKRKILDYSRFSKIAEVKNLSIEFISKISEIKINNAQRKKINEWKAKQDDLNKVEIKSYYLNYNQIVGSNFLIRFKDIAITAFCAISVVKGNMTLGLMMTIGFVIGQLNSPTDQLIALILGVQDSFLSYNRLNEVQKLIEEEKATQKIISNVSEYSIVLNNVSFKYVNYDTDYALKNIFLKIQKNKTTAIVGESGSGKTTLIKLLLSYYPPTEGVIYINDLDLEFIKPDGWREKCGIVLQNGNLYSGTIIDNIALSDEHPDVNRIKESASLTCIDDFINSLPLNYYTEIGNSGVELSGGQAQRILLARAIYKKPPVLFLDEATSSLDANTEKTIVNNLQTFFKGKTVVIIAHRLSTVKNADQIVVLEKGQVVEMGNHTELTAKKGKYYNLVKNQLELGN